MDIEYLRALLGKSRDSVACGQSILQMIEGEMMKLKKDVEPEDWVRLDSALKKAKDIVESTQRTLVENEKHITLVPRISDDELRNLRSRVKMQNRTFRDKISFLEHLVHQLDLKRQTHGQAYKDESEKLMDSIRNQEQLMAALGSRLLELEAEGPEGDDERGNLLIPRLVFDAIESPAVTGGLEYGTRRTSLRVPMSCEGVSRESGISDGSSPGYRAHVDDNYRLSSEA